jgi:hypothetical protein
MKPSSVIGTPFHSIKASNSQGMMHGAKPSGMSGTVNRQFEGDQKINREEGISTGTPYQSRDGNGPETIITRSHGLYGMVIGESGDNQNPKDNGNGVILDGIDRARDYTAKPRPNLDSPVPEGSQKPQSNASIKLNEIRNGEGKYWGADDVIEDHLLKANGVMSRGLDNTEDDVGEQKDEERKPFGFKRTAEDQQQHDDDRG